MDPREAVAGNLVAQFHEGGRELGVALQAVETPNTVSGAGAFQTRAGCATHTRAVFINAFHAHVPLGVAGGLNISDKTARCRIAVQHGVSPPSS